MTIREFRFFSVILLFFLLIQIVRQSNEWCQGKISVDEVFIHYSTEHLIKLSFKQLKFIQTIGFSPLLYLFSILCIFNWNILCLSTLYEVLQNFPRGELVHSSKVSKNLKHSHNPTFTSLLLTSFKYSYKVVFYSHLSSSFSQPTLNLLYTVSSSIFAFSKLE
jgi:hypothetical protein